MIFKLIKYLTLLGLLNLTGVTSASASLTIEYIGHASFVIESEKGVRVVIDPFNSIRWLGLTYPEGIEADLMLVTHPHFDHDATYYFPDTLPIFREPAQFSFGDIEVHGIEGRHSSPWGQDIDHKNTIWVIESAGIRIAHLGDNTHLSRTNIHAIGDVDVLIMRADGDQDAASFSDINSAGEALKPTLIIPNHHRHEGFMSTNLGMVKLWAQDHAERFSLPVKSLEGNRLKLAGSPSGPQRILIFKPSPELTEWKENIARAWEYSRQAVDLLKKDAGALRQTSALAEKAYNTGKDIVFAMEWAKLLVRMKENGRAVSVLEESLVQGCCGDWQYRMEARVLLGRLYHEMGRIEDAVSQYRIVLRNGQFSEPVREARGYLESLQ